ncbi:sulfite exporter TauE/SafE family protein [Geomesophilobacter sediminis]|uniref:Sulfite exporter TauE/SafE family protein n=1 Tax=Geomesophilobacter sediminis TaxID=2798584 RepID=A0A8J7M0N3_9BACT|nr:sulfite exporter TauE/SafE family protein [Geomesophilobacter sediminis]MBJ6726087.1 sulfite exporter TauE/SafE family protein [Geomesophilobacter sediminis]
MNEWSTTFLLGLTGGAAAFAHCLGMCGGFVLLQPGPKALRRQLLWHAGRLSSYLLLAALAAHAGATLSRVLAGGGVQNLIGWATGAVMVAAGMSLLGVLPVRGGKGCGALLRLAGELFTTSSPGAPLLMGVVSGLLPCPILLAFLAYAMERGSVPAALATMAGVGVGTTLPLLALGSTAAVVTARTRRWGVRGAAVLLLGLGAVTALRGGPLLHRFLPCPAAPQAIASETEPPGGRHGN